MSVHRARRGPRPRHADPELTLAASIAADGAIEDEYSMGFHPDGYTHALISASTGLIRVILDLDLDD